jgi:hypothetical protein
MVEALATYRRGESTLADLRNAVVGNGRAMEALPDALRTEIQAIEHRLTVAQWLNEDGFVPEEERVLAQLDTWLNTVPVDA